MAKTFRDWNLKQALLFPPSVNDYVPSDHLLVVHKDTNEYGYRYFGSDYGQALFAWLAQRYRPLQLRR